MRKKTMWKPRVVKAADADEPKNIVTCKEEGVVLVAASSKKWELDVPVTFQWMPGGVHTINAHCDSKPIELTVCCDESAAKLVNASYQHWFDIRPKQVPFGCVEHREEEAAIRLPKDIAAFEWKNEPEPGIYCTCTPTELGAKNVNGRIHSSWSPSFGTDAEYHKATEVGGRLVFPKGARGARDNPAKVTAVAFSVGSLTNKPAFRQISPVRAKQTDPEEGTKVDATWSEAAREASARAREMSKHAHKRTEEIHKNPNDEFAQHEARDHHQIASARHKEAMLNYPKGSAMRVHHAAMTHYHEAMAEHHHSAAISEVNKKHFGASEVEERIEQTIDAKYATAAEDIYAKYAEPEDPLQALYDRVETVENDQPAGRN